MEQSSNFLGPYRILSPLGSGGMGTVHIAEHIETGRRVALKTVLVPHVTELAAIRTEVQALSRIVHPAIVQIFDTGVHDGSPWYAMELLDGQTLQHYLRDLWARWSPPTEAYSGSNELTNADSGASAAAIPVRAMHGGTPAAAGRLTEVLTLLRHLCSPLAYLHERGIVHRDLKPGNVFVRHDGRPVLMDFGLVSRFGGATGRDVLEVAGTLVGTAAYMAPEQILRQRVDARTDLYALGCMLYELVAGRPPFIGNSVRDTLQQHLTVSPDPLSAWVIGVPEELDQLALSLLAKRPRDRIGHADDVAAWLVTLGANAEQTEGTDARGAPAGYLYRPELAGRDGVMATLHRHVERALAGAGGFVLLGGESGVGKTSLVGEVARDATLHQLMVVAGECQPIGGAALHPLLPLVRAIFDRAVEQGPIASARFFGPRARVLAAVEPALASLPGFDQWPEPTELPLDAARARLLADLRETIATFSEEQPLLLVLDDLQWADVLSLQFLLTTQPMFFEENAVLVIATYRSEETSPLLNEVLAMPGVERCDLGRLDEPAVGSMVSDMLALAAPPLKFIQFLTAQSDGNPFFVAEYLRTAVAERLLQRTAGKWIVGGGAMDDEAYLRLPLPGSLRELIGRRLSGLSLGEASLANVASVLGREFDAALLLDAAGMAEADAMEAIRELTRRQVLERTDAGRYRFVHDKLRETAYAAIALDRRAALHASIAKSIEAVHGGTAEFPRFYRDLAEHYQQAGRRPQAIDYLEKAADQAGKVFADRDAADYLAEALRLSDIEGDQVDAARRTRWRGELGMALRGLGQLEAARANLEQMLREMGHPIRTASAVRTVWHVVRELSLRRGLRRPPVGAENSNPAAVAAIGAYNYVAMIAYHQSDVLGQVYCTFAALRLAPRSGPSAAAAQLYASTANMMGFFGLHRLARRYGRLSHRIAEAASHPLSVGIAHQYTGHLAAFQGDLPTFEADMQRALEVYTRAGHHRFREEALTNLAYLHLFRGELARALTTFQEIELSGRARNDKQTTGWGMQGQARAITLMGRLDEAVLRYADASTTICDDLSRLNQVTGLSVVLAALGDREGAEINVEGALAILKGSTNTSYTSVCGYSDALEALFLLWDPADRSASSARHRRIAGELCAAMGRFARMIPLARTSLHLWRGVYAWRQGRPRPARRHWHQALAGAHRVGLPMDEARIHLWMGRSLGGDERAVHLRRAQELFTGMNCLHAAREASRLLETPEVTPRDDR